MRLFLTFSPTLLSYPQASTGPDMLQKTVALSSSRVRMRVWDIPASPWLRDFVPGYVRDAHAAVVVYSREDRTSFEAVAEWAALARKHAKRGNDLPLLLVGTHTDGADAGCVVDAAEGQAAADDLGALASIQLAAREAGSAAALFCRIARYHDAAYWKALQEGQGGSTLANLRFEDLPSCSNSNCDADTLMGVHAAPGAASRAETPVPATCCDVSGATQRVLKNLSALVLGGDVKENEAEASAEGKLEPRAAELVVAEPTPITATRV